MLPSRNAPSSDRWTGWGARIYLSCIVSAVGLFVFEFGCYVPAGKAIRSTEGIAGGKRWEVWFRKNATSSEPFAAGLFIEQATNEWNVYLLDIQAIRSPRFSIGAQGTNFAVMRGPSLLGRLDQEFLRFQRVGSTEPEMPGLLHGPPPGNWWLAQ
jgi:hypothetical protein